MLVVDFDLENTFVDLLVVVHDELYKQWENFLD